MASTLCNACAAVVEDFRHCLGLHCCAAPFHCLSPFFYAAWRSNVLALLQSVAVGGEADREVWCCQMMHGMLTLTCWLAIKKMAKIMSDILGLGSWLCVQGKRCKGWLELPVGTEARGERLRDRPATQRPGGSQAILRGRHAMKLLGNCRIRPWS